MYPSGNGSAPVIIRDAGNLIRKMKQVFGWLDDSEMINVATKAGADGVFRLPYSADDVLPTLRRCLDQVRGW